MDHQYCRLCHHHHHHEKKELWYWLNISTGRYAVSRYLNQSLNTSTTNNQHYCYRYTTNYGKSAKQEKKNEQKCSITTWQIYAKLHLIMTITAYISTVYSSLY